MADVAKGFGSNPKEYKFAWFTLKGTLKSKKKWDIEDLEQAMAMAETVAIEAAKTE